MLIKKDLLCLLSKLINLHCTKYDDLNHSYMSKAYFKSFNFLFRCVHVSLLEGMFAGPSLTLFLTQNRIRIPACFIFQSFTLYLSFNLPFIIFLSHSLFHSCSFSIFPLQSFCRPCFPWYSFNSRWDLPLWWGLHLPHAVYAPKRFSCIQKIYSHEFNSKLKW